MYEKFNPEKSRFTGILLRGGGARLSREPYIGLRAHVQRTVHFYASRSRAVLALQWLKFYSH